MANEPGRKAMYGIEESQTKSAVTALAVVEPVAQTRAPTGNLLGPLAGLLLSSPMTFQVRGVTVRTTAASARWAPSGDITAAAPTRSASRRAAVFFIPQAPVRDAAGPVC